MNNSYKKILKREDGTRVEIAVSIIDMQYRDLEYRVDGVSFCEKGKRKFKNPAIKDKWKLRSMPMEDREKALMDGYLTIASADEIHQAKEELWESLKPVR